MFITNKEKKIIVVIVLLVIVAVASFLLLTRNGGVVRITERWDGCGEDITYHGQAYSTVEIAGMCFFQDNLNTGKYSTGDEIRYIGEMEVEEGLDDDPFANFSARDFNRYNALVSGYVDSISEQWQMDGVTEEEELEERASRAYGRLLSDWDSGKPFEFDAWELMVEEVFMELSADWGLQAWKEEDMRETEEELEGEWESATEGAYTYYDFDSEMGEVYGKLYNFYAVEDERGICPEGWRVPTDEDWMALESSLGMCEGEGSDCTEGVDERGRDGRVGQKLKSKLVWDHPTDEGTGESGFDALPGGFRSGNEMFMGIGDTTYFWSSTEGGRVRNRDTVWVRSLIQTREGVNRTQESKNYGNYVRCVIDLE